MKKVIIYIFLALHMKNTFFFVHIYYTILTFSGKGYKHFQSLDGRNTDTPSPIIPCGQGMGIDVPITPIIPNIPVTSTADSLTCGDVTFLAVNTPESGNRNGVHNIYILFAFSITLEISTS